MNLRIGAGARCLAPALDRLVRHRRQHLAAGLPAGRPARRTGQSARPHGSAFELGGGYRAPGQRVGDLIQSRPSTAFDTVQLSYQPSVTPTNLAERGRGSLPDNALAAIREALPAFERQIRGFAMPDAVLTGVETRTSSPLRITRGKDYQSVNVAGLYPAGEGAGDVGGIMSAGVDGIGIAEALATDLPRRPAPA